MGKSGNVHILNYCVPFWDLNQQCRHRTRRIIRVCTVCKYGCKCAQNLPCEIELYKTPLNWNLARQYGIETMTLIRAVLRYLTHMSRVVRKPFFCIYAKTKTQISFAVTVVVCVGPGRKPRRPVFSQRGSYKPSVSCMGHRQTA